VVLGAVRGGVWRRSRVGCTGIRATGSLLPFSVNRPCSPNRQLLPVQ
jgi:hypothetical protein